MDGWSCCAMVATITCPSMWLPATKKTVNVDKYYNTERLRPKYESFEMQPLFIMTSDRITFDYTIEGRWSGNKGVGRV